MPLIRIKFLYEKYTYYLDWIILYKW